MNRRTFLVGLLAAAPFGAALAAMLERGEATRPPRQVRLKPDPARSVTFAGDVVVHRDGPDRLTVLSSRCTHLGCRISKQEGDELVCPCHGSRFGLDGSVRTGPATRPLAALACAADPATGELLVELP